MRGEIMRMMRITRKRRTMDNKHNDDNGDK